jgi:hypothetical protein
LKSFAFAIATTLVFAAPAYAHEHWHHHDVVRGAPGPIAGAGLPILLAAGGFYAWKRWRKRVEN